MAKTLKARRTQSESNRSEANGPLVLQARSASFSGPIPPPDILAQYSEIIPNGAERIMAMAEKQSAHRELIEDLVINGNVSAQKRGAYFAFTICVLSLVFGFVLIEQGKSTDGLVTILASLGSVAATFVYSKYRESRERTEKLNALAARKAGR